MPEIAEIFKNAPLVEAVCEFRFKSENWDPTISGIIFPFIKNEFPNKESVREGNVEFFLDSKTKESPRISHSESEFPKFSNASGNIFAIFKKNIISIHCIRPYLGWNDFYNKISFIFKAYKENAVPEKLERIGLRYINKIIFPKESFNFSEYFKISPTPLESTIRPEDIVAMQIGAISKDGDSLIKTQLMWLEGKTEENEFILDIDCFATNSEVDVDDWLVKSHSKIEKIFLDSITDKAKETFK